MSWEIIKASREIYKDYPVIVSQELRRAMLAHKLRGADFTPMTSHLDVFEA
jgi:hypothetical protein